ncbi:MAG: OB-fold domain-containing protein, partial [candidate division WOR-3 bacterium]
MFFKIKGKIIYKEPFKLGVEVEFGESSITYEILTPLKIYEKYKEGDKIELFIYTYLKEDEFSLYGFEKKE